MSTTNSNSTSPERKIGLLGITGIMIGLAFGAMLFNFFWRDMGIVESIIWGWLSPAVFVVSAYFTYSILQRVFSDKVGR